MNVNYRDKPMEIFYKSIIAGTGWVLGVTVGFTVLVTIFSFVLSTLGGLPVIGEFVATLVEVTNTAMTNRRF
jgi:hypothetical protein